MRAAVVDRYGPPETVRIDTVPVPPIGRDEVLVRVLAAPVTAADARIRGARFPRGFGVPARLGFGLTGPRRRILGGSFAGRVAAAGAAVRRVAPGGAVCGMTGLRLGSHAEFVAVRAASVVPVPADVNLDDAAGVLFGGTTALHFLRDRVTVRPGASVLVNGASGAVGTNAVQLAKHHGARVTAVCSGANAALVTGLGADVVIDHTVTDPLATAERFDVVLDLVGTMTVATARRLIVEGGKAVLAVAGLTETIRARGDVIAGSAPERTEDMAHLLELVASRALTVVQDRSFALDGIVEAHRIVDSGRKRGNVILRP